ncbi:MAG: FkbM family methyltransferase [Cyanobacteriota bacterium]|nr:FkbM family methyltransferase [Cyanobacteriota bacterium]
MPTLDYFNRPEYLLRPFQLYRRLLHPPHQAINSFKTVLLPWGVPLKIYPKPEEVVERSVWIFGIYDLSLSETLWRLVDGRETVLDIGANIGYTASLLAHRVGVEGKVFCFEPHPEIYAELVENVKVWQEMKGWSQIQLHQIALSERSGLGCLKIPPTNRAAAALDFSQSENSSQKEGQSYSVPLQQLDEFWKEERQIHLIKIDVEGHEYQVFQGAKQLLERGLIRDIVFEEHQIYPSKATEYLEKRGYHIFRLWKGFWKPILLPANYNRFHPWEPPNYLATIDPKRAVARFQQRGWNCFDSNP